MKRVIQQEDSNLLLGTIAREYSVRLPEKYTGDVPLPVFFYFHGWGDDYTADMKFHQMANQQNAIVVKGNGMTDGQDSMRSWNVGQAGRTDICNHQDVTEFEYTSCLTTSNTSICNAGTCYDDVKFVSDLAAKLRSELCVDDDRIFMSGTSYGALFSYFLPQQLQYMGSELRVRAILPWYGAFYRHMLDVPDTLAGTSVLHFHGISDVEIPMNTSESWDGYYYVPTDTTLGRYAEINGCARTSTPFPTPFDGMGHEKNGLLRGCAEWYGCASGARVVRCDFDGAHGIWPGFAEQLMWHFLETLDSPKGLAV